jgi:pimeloyl-ACP methyl ester carboxylesterase
MRPPDLAGIRARVLLIRGRYDWVVPVEVSIGHRQLGSCRLTESAIG